MRWIVLKDLQILRRSKLLVGLLVVYPIAIALLIGFALSSGPDKPRVAFLDEIPPGRDTITLGTEKVDVSRYADSLFTAVEKVPVATREEAVAKVRSGEALAALIIPSDFALKLSGQGFQAGPTVEVLYNGDALKQSVVRTTVDAQLAQANAALARQFNHVAAGYIDAIAQGGTIAALGNRFELFGIRRSKARIDAELRASPTPATHRRLAPVAKFMAIGSANFTRFKDVLTNVERPVGVSETLLSGHRAPLDTFAVALAVSVSLMFVCVLLASGLLALEREEHTLTRLARGLVGPARLLSAKIVLAAGCAFAVTLAMLAGISAFVRLDWSRFGLWVVALAVSALAFAALGVAIGSIAREVRAASMLAFLLSLPLAFLALVPSGAVSPALFDVIRAISAIFPFKPALDAVNAAVNDATPSLGTSLAHLGALIVVFAAAARAGLRRLA
jgi:ABC-type multidrug transport system permease subunit